MKKFLFTFLLLLTACSSEKSLAPAEIQTSVVDIPEPTPSSIDKQVNGNLWVLKFDSLPYGFWIPKEWEISESSSEYKVAFGKNEHHGFMTFYKDPSRDSFQEIVTQAAEVFYNDGKGVRVYCDGLDGYLATCVVQSDVFDGLYVIEVRQSAADEEKIRNVISSVNAD